MKTLPVNFGDLALALEDQGGELHVYYFDTETGAVLNLSEDIDEAELHEIREEGSGRFLRIEPMNPRAEPTSGARTGTKRYRTQSRA
jgi:hypothetical protein